MRKWLKFLIFGIPLVFLASLALPPAIPDRPYMKPRRVEMASQHVSDFAEKMKKGMEEVYSEVIASVKDLKTSFFMKEQKEAVLSDEEMLRVMSFNVRWDGQEESPEISWDKRKNQVASVIRFHRVDLAGLQEPFKKQMDDLAEMLLDYGWVGVGLDDGKDKGPMDSIMYRKSRFEVQEEGNFFLSPTPGTPSKGWDAKFPRGVIWVKFLDKKTKKSFFVFNTHFDYHGKLARDESAFLLREQISEIAKEDPFIVTGDFNLFPELGGLETYRILTQGNEEIEGKILRDAHHIAKFPHHGPTGSWSGFKEAGQPGIKPDYIFVGKSLDVVSHGILADCFDGKFPSDHLPIVADIIVK